MKRFICKVFGHVTDWRKVYDASPEYNIVMRCPRCGTNLRGV